MSSECTGTFPRDSFRSWIRILQVKRLTEAQTSATKPVLKACGTHTRTHNPSSIKSSPVCCACVRVSGDGGKSRGEACLLQIRESGSVYVEYGQIAAPTQL